MVPEGMVHISYDHCRPGIEVSLWHCVEHIPGSLNIPLPRITRDHNVPSDSVSNGHFIEQDTGVPKVCGGVDGEERSGDVNVSRETEFENVGVEMAYDGNVIGARFKSQDYRKSVQPASQPRVVFEGFER